MSDMKKRILRDAVIIAAAVGGLLWWFQYKRGNPNDGQEPKPVPVRPAEDTTWLTEPLYPDGTVNYIQPINARYRRGVMPRNNAAVDLLAIYAPRDLSDADRELLARRMGLDSAPAPGAMPLYGFFGRQDNDEMDIVARRDLLKASAGPWSPQQLPKLSEYLDTYKRQLDRLVAASDKDHLFVPLYARSRPERLVAAERPLAAFLAESTLAVMARATRSAGQEQFAAARKDIIAALRLCRLTSGSMVSYEATAAYRDYQRMLEGAMVCLSAGNWPEDQARGLLDDIRSLPPMQPLLDTANWHLRLRDLDAMQVCAVDGLARGMGLLSDQYEIQGLEDVGTNYNSAMRLINSWYDRRLRVLDVEDPARRRQVQQEIWKAWDSFRSDVDRRRYLKDGRLAPADTVEVIVHLVVRSPLYLADYPRDSQVLARNMAIAAAALAAHKARHGRYPDSLEELTPGLLAEVPADPLGAGPLKYKPAGQTALLYSVGYNRRDDDGREVLREEMDDISLQMR